MGNAYHVDSFHDGSEILRTWQKCREFLIEIQWFFSPVFLRQGYTHTAQPVNISHEEIVQSLDMPTSSPNSESLSPHSRLNESLKAQISRESKLFNNPAGTVTTRGGFKSPQARYLHDHAVLSSIFVPKTKPHGTRKREKSSKQQSCLQSYPHKSTFITTSHPVNIKPTFRHKVIRSHVTCSRHALTREQSSESSAQSSKSGSTVEGCYSKPQQVTY